MKRLLWLLCLSFVLFSCGVNEDVKVISMNLRYSTPTDGDNWWQYRKEAVVAMVDSMCPDVMGTQECTGDMEDYLLENLPSYSDVYACRESGDQMNVLYYNTDRLDLISSGIFWLSPSPDSMSIGWDAAFRRTMVWGNFRIKGTDKTFYHFNTHMDHIGRVAREESVKLIVAKVREIVPEGTPFIITGDFNSSVDESIFDPLKAIAYSVRHYAPKTDSSYSYNSFGKGVTAVIDHIFESGFEPVSFETLNGDFGVPYISDHYPIKAVLH